jgi:UDP-glucose 4-epimerase
MSKIRYVVTGASGFIGRQILTAEHAIQDIEIVGVSRSKTSYAIQVSDYDESPPGDVLIHLAEDSNANRISNEVVGSELSERLATRRIETLLNKKYDRVVYISSAALYRDNMTRSLTTSDPIDCKTPYSQLKYQIEKRVLSDPRGRVIRVGNVYGEFMSKKNVFSQIIGQLPIDGDLIVNDERPVRDFIAVDDVAEGIIKISSINSMDPKSDEIYNLGTGLGTSVGSLCRLILDQSGQFQRKVVSRVRSESTSSIVLDCTKTTKTCDWVPKISLQRGISMMLSPIDGAQN